MRELFWRISGILGVLELVGGANAFVGVADSLVGVSIVIAGVADVLLGVFNALLGVSNEFVGGANAMVGVSIRIRDALVSRGRSIVETFSRFSCLLSLLFEDIDKVEICSSGFCNKNKSGIRSNYY